MTPLSSDADGTPDLLRRALADEAAEVRPDPHALRSIQQRTAVNSPDSSDRTRGLSVGTSRTDAGGRPWMLGAFGAAAATVAVIAAAAIVSNSGDTGGTPAAGPGRATDAAGETTGQLGATGAPMAPADHRHPGRYDPNAPTANQVTVYYVARSANGAPGEYRLYPEQHTVQATGGSTALASVHELLTSTAIDHDYSTPWPPYVDVRSITTAGGLTTIDLSGARDLSVFSVAPGPPGPDDLAFDALLSTAGIQGEVQFTDLGRPLGEAVTLRPSDETRAWVSITSPVEGQTVSSPVTVNGSANVFEANVNWDLLDADGQTIDQGFASGGSMEWKPFTIDLGQLDPGTYTIRAYEASPKNGRPTFIDDKTFTVS